MGTTQSDDEEEAMPRGTDEDGYTRSRAQFGEVVGWLDGDEANALSHAELADRLDAEGRELLRLLDQDHLDLRAERETRCEEVTAADGVNRRFVEARHARALTTIFGEVTVTRLAYRRRGGADSRSRRGVDSGGRGLGWRAAAPR